MRHMLAPAMMRRMVNSSQAMASRNFFKFEYPHSFSGTNNAFNNIPSKKQEVNRDLAVGAEAPLAHTDVRVFPEWYKPWTYNYMSDGYLFLFLGTFLLFGYSYINDIKEQKGRRSRKVFESQLPTNAESLRKRRYALDRIKAGDENFTKYLKPKERAAVHHH